jgi:MFS superfamily sulfate permease-like transporter
MHSSKFANIVSGSLIALVNISVAVSVAALLFAQIDTRLMVPGIAILLIGTFVTGLGGALFSGYKSVICSPRNGLAPLFGVMIASIYASFGSEYSIGAEATIIVAFMVTTLITGLFLLLLGRLKLGNLVRYIPYPVSGGFFAGIGYIFIQGGLSVAGNENATLSRMVDSQFLQLALPAIVLALCLIAGKMFRDNRLAVPLILLLSVLIFYALLTVTGVSREDAALRGLLPTIEATGTLVPVFHFEFLQEVKWIAISHQLGGIVVVAIILFVVNYSQLSVIKIETNGSDHASNVDRDLETRELLNQEGKRVLILILQGFIFFGTADKLISAIRNRIMDVEGSHFDYLVLDFHHVSQLDTSAIVTFSKLAQLSDRIGFHVVISGADEKSIKQLVKHQFFTFGDQQWERNYKQHLDMAMDWCERHILTDLNRDGEQKDLALEDVLGRIAYSEADIEHLSTFFEVEQREAGEYLFREGDKGESLYFVGSGVVVVVLKLPRQQENILRKYTAGAILGEMAIYTGEKRTASVRTETSAVLFRLDKDKLDAMGKRFPASTAALNTYIVRVLAERLHRANRNLSRYI